MFKLQIGSFAPDQLERIKGVEIISQEDGGYALAARQLKAQVAGFGRKPDQVLVMPGVMPVVGRTETEAQATFAELNRNIDTAQAFTTSDQRLLTIVATSAGAAIANAQYLEQQTARANQLATLNRVASLLTGTLAPDAVLDAIASSAAVVIEATEPKDLRVISLSFKLDGTDDLGDLDSLKRFKDDATEVKEGYECGIGLGSFKDIQIGDVIQTYEMREKKRA